LIKLHPQEDALLTASDEDLLAPAMRTGTVKFMGGVADPVSDSLYELELNFDNDTFLHTFTRTLYEEGDGVQQTIYRGTFSREGSLKKRKKTKSKGQQHVLMSPRSPPATSSYYVCKAIERDVTSHFEPWDSRLAAKENVNIKASSFHSEFLFRIETESRIVNESSPAQCTLEETSSSNNH